MNLDSAVAVADRRRIHIGLVVSDLVRSTKFYRTLLGVEPSKQRPGYAKFEPIDPPINLSLNQVPDLQMPRNPAFHYGIQVQRSEHVVKAAVDLRQAGITTVLEQETECCYSVQDRVWAVDPDGYRWEVFVVLDNNAGSRNDEHSICCRGQESASCC